jgi:hypothetical protein
MRVEIWISSGSFAVAAGALFHTFWNGRRTSEASLRAVNADNRAEEALQIAKVLEERDRQRFEREKADMDAPQIAERWVSEMHYKWGAHSRHGQYDLTKEVKTPAERRAVEILRENEKFLHVIGIDYDAEKQVCTISAWDALGCKRNTGEPGRPPKIGGAG